METLTTATFDELFDEAKRENGGRPVTLLDVIGKMYERRVKAWCDSHRGLLRLQKRGPRRKLALRRWFLSRRARALFKHYRKAVIY